MSIRFDANLAYEDSEKVVYSKPRFRVVRHLKCLQGSKVYINYHVQARSEKKEWVTLERYDSYRNAQHRVKEASRIFDRI